MSSGEADAIRNIIVNDNNSSYPNTPTITWDKINTAGTSNVSNFSYVTWPNYVYMYQIKCPVRSCKTLNWMQLDMIVPCSKCGIKLKAVSQKADFEIEVNK